MFDWLKRLSPRGIYGRAALILIVPIFTIQLVVSLAFIQRHFEDVTRQMTRNIVLEIASVLKAGESKPDLAGALRAMSGPASDLSLEVMGGDAAGRETDPRAFYDLSGKVVIETLRDAFPDTLSVDLSEDRRVALTVAAGPGPVRIEFDRRRVSATNPHQLLVLMLATGLLMTLIAFGFLRNQMRPIRQLARAAEGFGRGRNVYLKPSGATEVRAAANAFQIGRAHV